MNTSRFSSTLITCGALLAVTAASSAADPAPSPASTPPLLPALPPGLAMPPDAPPTHPTEVDVNVRVSTQPSALAANSDDREAARRSVTHGFRLGGAMILNIDSADASGRSFRQRYDLRSPYLFTIGYEVTKEVRSGSWLNLVFVGNASISGLNQNKVLPSINGLIGFEFEDSFQLGVGSQLTLEKDGEDKTVPSARMIMAAGWTPSVGSFETPVHVTVVPDPEGAHRVGLTVGVNW